MYRKILFRNKIASAIIGILACRLFFVSYNLFSVGMRNTGSITLGFALAFSIVGIGIYSNKLRILMGMKLLFIVITLLLIIGGMFFLISNPLTSLTETPLLVFCIMLLVCISFIITLDLQQKRLKTPLDQLPLAQKSDRKQRVFGLITFFIVIIITLIYFIIGKHAQSVPFVSETYFEKTRVNPTLSDEENGYEQLRALIGDIRHPLDEETLATYPFQVPTANGYRELGYGASLGREGNPSLTERLNAELQRIFNEGRPRPSREYYGTLAELLQAHPEVHPEAAIQTLEQSDFFTRLEKIVAMEWRDDDMFPTLQGIQGLERSLAYLAAYHADKGEFSTGIYYNTLALKLADKYLSNYSSLTQGLIATICLRTAMDATEYLLNHYELSPTDKAILLETYDTLLTTDIATAFQNIYKGEYHMIMNLSNGFEINSPDEITSQINIDTLLSLLTFRKPFYNAQMTHTKYKYAMKELMNKTSLEEIGKKIGMIHRENETIRVQPRNLYNFIGNSSLMGLLPRLEGSYTTIETLYQQKSHLLQQL